MTDDSLVFATDEEALRREKLQLEIAALKEAHFWNNRLGRFLPAVSTLVPVLALLFAIQQYSLEQRRSSDVDITNSQRAFMQPVLTRQLDLYLGASSAVATLASSTNAAEQAKARDEFWRLYWGPLVMLESPDVSIAMKKVGKCLEDADRACSRQDLQDLSLILSSSLTTDYFSAWSLSPEKYAARTINYANSRRPPGN
jgi:hypothetical protein